MEPEDEVKMIYLQSSLEVKDEGAGRARRGGPVAVFVSVAAALPANLFTDLEGARWRKMGIQHER
jgi:hypothetical protein